MPKYAAYDASATPSFLGWYDTDWADYPKLPEHLLEVTDEQWEARLVDPSAWAVHEGKLVPYKQPEGPLTPAEQAMAALAAGIKVSSKSTPAIDGTYAMTAAQQMHLGSEISAIALGGVFADDSEALVWPDIAGKHHTFTVPQFKAFAKACLGWTAAWRKFAAGVTESPPGQSVELHLSGPPA